MKPESNSKKSKVNSKLLLPEDLVIDILSRVSLKCLLNSARYVCKSWATIISSSNFAEVYRQCACSKPGLFVQNIRSESNSFFLDITNDSNGHFEKIDLGTHPRMGSLMGTCDGILLFCSVLGLKVIVVNPIIKCWLEVPPLPTRESLAIWTLTITRVPLSSIFKLFFFDVRKVSGVDWFIFYVLKVGIDNSWKVITRQKVHEHYYFRRHVYNGGSDLYWILEGRVNVMDVDKEIIVGEYPLLPFEMGRRSKIVYYLWTGNHLSCIARKCCSETFRIYILDTILGKWTLYHEVVLFDYVVACGLELDIVSMQIRVWINSQIIFQVLFRPREKLIGLKRIHFSYNVETRQLTKIEGIPEGTFDVCLHTNSLTSFPSTP